MAKSEIRLIDASAFREILQTWSRQMREDECYNDALVIDDVISQLDAAPTVDGANIYIGSAKIEVDLPRYEDIFKMLDDIKRSTSRCERMLWDA